MSAKRKTTTPWAYRRDERTLLGVAALALTSGFLTLFLLRFANAPLLNVGTFRSLMALGVCLAAFAIVHVALVAARSRSTPYLLPPVLLLAAIGMLLRFRLGVPLDRTSLSLLAYPAGLAVLVICAVLLSRGRCRSLASARWLCWLAGIGIMALLVVAGSRFRGAIFAWGGLTPTELLKPLMVIVIAATLAPHARTMQRRGELFPPAEAWLFGVPWALLMGLLAWQRDLGMIVMLNGVLLLMVFAAAENKGVLVLGAIGLLTAAVAAAVIPYVRHRFAAWLAPWESPTGGGWQIMQSLSAFYSGGLLGSGLGEGAPRAIPVASSDFIYASIGEELGYLGCGLVLLCYLAIFREGLAIAGACRNPFERLLAIGLVTILALQTTLNVGGVTKALPLTGVPLPLVSLGGSSFIASMVGIGLLLALSDTGSPRRRNSRPRPGAKRRAAR